MRFPRTMAHLLVSLPVLAGTILFLFNSEPVRGTDFGSSRLINATPFPESMAGSCTWETAAYAPPSFQAPGGRAAGGAGPSMGDPVVAARTPQQTIRDPYPGFAAIRVDPVHNEVVVMDEFKFDIYVYDRLAVTPAWAPATTPKRVIGGGKTLSRYNSDGYVDTKTGDIYVANYGTERDEVLGSVQQMPNPLNTVNLRPGQQRPLNWPAGNTLPYSLRSEVVFGTGKFGPPSIVVHRADAEGNAEPVRVIQGAKAQL